MAEGEVVTLAGGGVVKKVLRGGVPGGEKPPRNAEVVVQYVGRLQDGTEFDRSSPSRPFKFKLGEGRVIKGWDLGVATMVQGEKAELTCRADYAYGDRGAPPKIPPGATLVFEVDLVEFSTRKSLTEDGGVMKEEIADGEGHNHPNLFGQVSFRYKAMVVTGAGERRVFDDSYAGNTRSATLDEAGNGLVAGLEEGLKSMLKGERCRLFVRPEYGYGADGNKELGVPPGASLVYEVHLLDFTKARETWQMDEEEKLAHATRLKERGNASFKAEEFVLAARWYRKALDVFRHEDPRMSAEMRAKIAALKTQAASNLSACALKTDSPADAIAAATEALQADPNNSKALFRRGSGHLKLMALNDAEKDFLRANELDPDNATITAYIKRVRALQRQEREKEKKLFGNMFTKVSLTDSAGSSSSERAAAADSRSSGKDSADLASMGPL